MFKITFSILLIGLLTACGNESQPERENGYSDVPQTPQDSLFKEVMDGHDVGMARMGKLAGYKKRLDQEIDSLKKANPRLSRNVENVYTDIRQKLQEAEDGMNRWMDEFKIDSAEDRVADRIKYLTDEKMKVDKVKNDILRALERADSLLQNRSKQNQQ